jgi:adenosylmethionine-8-amino-7-oxononanoate aminotransferase
MEMQEVVDHMFLPLPGLPPVLITKTEGVYLHDSSGHRIIDASGGPLAVNIGYGRREVADAAARVLRQVSYVLPVFASEARIDLVKRLKKMLPEKLRNVYLCSGGSEANEAALKFARQLQVLSGRESRHKVISRNLSYHGMTLMPLSIGDVKMRQRDFLPMLWKNPRVEACYCYRCPFGKEYPGCDIDCALELEERILAEGPDTVAAFIAEPIVAAAGGALVPPPEYFRIIHGVGRFRRRARHRHLCQGNEQRLCPARGNGRQKRLRRAVPGAGSGVSTSVHLLGPSDRLRRRQ